MIVLATAGDEFFIVRESVDSIRSYCTTDFDDAVCHAKELKIGYCVIMYFQVSDGGIPTIQETIYLADYLIVTDPVTKEVILRWRDSITTGYHIITYDDIPKIILSSPISDECWVRVKLPHNRFVFKPHCGYTTSYNKLVDFRNEDALVKIPNF